MEALRSMVTGVALLFVACVVSAQTGTPAASGASASAPGMSSRGGMGGRHAMGGRWGSGMTAGWSMMTAEERREHQARMQSMTNYADCKAYVDEHHQEMLKRATEKGRAAPAQPRRDACAGLKR